MLSLGLQNLLSPMVLFFFLGLLAVWAKSDLSVPEAVAKFLALYLLLSIGFRGGAEVSHHGLTAPLLLAIAAGIMLSFATPFIAYAFAIGAITGEGGMTMLKPFILDPFAGVLCLFLLDMGLVAGRGLRQGWRYLSFPVTSFAVVMPLIGATIAAALAVMLGFSVGSTAVLITLAASASYIAVPAAMRLALPAANPALALTLSLGVTFPFNLLVGIPLYIAVANRIAH